MEIGLPGYSPLPTLALERPGPLHHLLVRLQRAGGKSEVAILRAVLDCLEFLERYFTSLSCGMIRKFEDPPELKSLAHNSESSGDLRRLLRFALNRLESYGQKEVVRDLLACFFVHGKRSLPFSHARWLGVAGTESADFSQTSGWSYVGYFESLVLERDEAVLRNTNSHLVDILRSWIEGASSFFEGYRHFARLDENGWQCTIQKDDIFIEFVPPIPARLIPVEADTPMAVPRTEDESFLFEEQSPYSQPTLEIGNPFEPLVTEPEVPSAATDDIEVSPEEDAGFEGGQEPEALFLGADLEMATREAYLASDDGESRADEEVFSEEPLAADGDTLSSAWMSQESGDYPSWSASELKSFDSVLRELYPKLDLERVPRDYFSTTNRFLSSVSSGYIILEGKQGAGKTLVAEAICSYLAGSSLDVVSLFFSIKNESYSDSTTFLEQLNEYIKVRSEVNSRSFEALDPQVIKSLNLRTSGGVSDTVTTSVDGEDLSSSAYRFSTYLRELRLVNDTRIVLAIDGLNEGTLSLDPADSLFRYLPSRLPDGVYVVLTYDPERLRSNDREVLEAIHLSSSTEILLSQDSSAYRDLVERFLNRGPGGPLAETLLDALMERSAGRLAPAQHMLDGLRCQLFEGVNRLPAAGDVYERLFDRLYARVPDRYLELFLLLATSDDPVQGEELSNLGISRIDALELVHSLPSLFHCRQERGYGLSLAHRAIRLHLQRTFLTSYAQSCLKLGRRALRRMSDSEITILPVREDLDLVVGAVRRLLRWAYDSGDIDFLAKVSRSKLLAKLRRRLFSVMEDKALYHRKALLLSTIKRGFEKLLLGEGKEEFREELAWSLSSRALCYYHLGHYQRALVDIQRAISHFQTMVEEQGLEVKRNGLAAALNRRSEIFLGMEDWQRALADADQAVANYEIVLASGRQDLFNLLMLAHHNRAIINRRLKRAAAADKDLTIALNGYLQLVDRDNRRDLRPQLAAVYQMRASVVLDKGDIGLALSSIASAIELYEVLVNQENFESLRNDLASCYNDRGAILARTRVFDEAERDYASAISIRTYLVAEGRLDVRIDLAKTYANRSLCLVSLFNLVGARESSDRAVEILDRLVEGENREDLYADRAFALSCRGEVLRRIGDMAAAREDLSSAASDYRMAVVSQSNEHLHMQARVLSSLAEIALSAGAWQESRRHSEGALKIYEQSASLDRFNDLSSESAIAHYNLGEALRIGGEELQAGKHFQQAISLLTREVEEKGRPQLIGSLASALFRFAQLDQQTSEYRLRLVSRALAFWEAASRSDSQEPDSLILEALLLRAEIYKKMGSHGLALDDVSKVIARLEKAHYVGAVFIKLLVDALLERAVLFLKLGDPEAALLDLDYASEVVISRQSVAEEGEFQHCLILLEKTSLACSTTIFDFAQALVFFQEFSLRFETITIPYLSLRDLSRLRARTAQAFKDLKYRALMPTREKSFGVAVGYLTTLIELVMELPASLSDFLAKNTIGASVGIESDQVVRLRTQRAWALFKQGDLLNALKDFEAVAAELPALKEDTSPDALEFVAEIEFGYGATLESLQRPQDALSAYNRAIVAFSRRPESLLSPRRASCLTNRAGLLAELGKYDEALIDISAASDIAESNYQKVDLIAALLYKAKLQQEIADETASLETLRRALSCCLQDGGLEPRYELPIRLGIYRLSLDESERIENLRLALVLMRHCLSQGLQEWQQEAIRLFSELPQPSVSPMGLTLEIEISRVPELMLDDFSPGYSPLTESLLRRAAKLKDLTNADRGFHTLSAAYYCLAAKFCLLEFQKYGRSSLPRLVRCYVLVALSLVTADTPKQIEGLGRGVNLIAASVLAEPPQGELEVEVNNMARLWLSLPPSKVLRGEISRANLQKLRRW